MKAIVSALALTTVFAQAAFANCLNAVIVKKNKVVGELAIEYKDNYAFEYLSRNGREMSLKEKIEKVVQGVLSMDDENMGTIEAAPVKISAGLTGHLIVSSKDIKFDLDLTEGSRSSNSPGNGIHSPWDAQLANITIIPTCAKK